MPKIFHEWVAGPDGYRVFFSGKGGREVEATPWFRMMLASCNSIPSAFAPDETATTGVTRQTNETRPERSTEDSVNSISGGHY
jgi:hypothetical protein